MTKKNQAGMSAADYAYSLGEESFDVSRHQPRTGRLQSEVDKLYRELRAGTTKYNQSKLKMLITRNLPSLHGNYAITLKVDQLIARDTSWGRDKFMTQLCSVLETHFNVVLSLRQTKG